MLYTSAFAFIAFQTVPYLQTVSLLMLRLDHFYARSLLKSDRNKLRGQRISNELFSKSLFPLCIHIVYLMFNIHQLVAASRPLLHRPRLGLYELCQR